MSNAWTDRRKYVMGRALDLAIIIAAGMIAIGLVDAVLAISGASWSFVKIMLFALLPSLPIWILLNLIWFVLRSHRRAKAAPIPPADVTT